MAFHAGGESIMRMCNGSICLNLLTAVMELHRISKPRMQLELTTICRNIENMSISLQLDARKGCNHNAKTIYENIWTHICSLLEIPAPFIRCINLFLMVYNYNQSYIQARKLAGYGIFVKVHCYTVGYLMVLRTLLVWFTNNNAIGRWHLIWCEILYRQETTYNFHCCLYE